MEIRKHCHLLARGTSFSARKLHMEEMPARCHAFAMAPSYIQHRLFVDHLPQMPQPHTSSRTSHRRHDSSHVGSSSCWLRSHLFPGLWHCHTIETTLSRPQRLATISDLEPLCGLDELIFHDRIASRIQVEAVDEITQETPHHSDRAKFAFVWRCTGYQGKSLTQCLPAVL